MTGDPLLQSDIYEDFFGEDNTKRQREAAKVRAEPKRQPHGDLKHRCRQALVKWRKERGLQAVLIPVQNVRVDIKGKNGRSIGKSFMTGRIGAGDDTWICGGIPFSLEYKHGHDTQRDTQARFQERWEAAGGVYLIVRSPEQMIAGVEAALRARHP